MKGITFVVDTNVLVHWALADVGHPPDLTASPRRDKVRRACARLCSDPKNSIYIPGVVWCEFVGVFLQRDIDIGDYPTWHRRRRALVSRVFAEALRSDGHVELGDGEFDLELVHAICNRPFGPDVLDWLRKGEERHAGGGPSTGRAFVPKLLDGMDSAVLASAWLLAEDRPEAQVVLVTDDAGVGQAYRWLRDAAPVTTRTRGGEKKRPVPENLRCRPALL